MTNQTLAESYLTKARARLAILPVLTDQQAYSDVVRESQEIVELALKAMLRQVGIEPPQWHDGGGFLLEYASRFTPDLQPRLPALAEASAWLRKEREFAFYGEIDLIPTERYGRADADRAASAAHLAVTAAAEAIEGTT